MTLLQRFLSCSHNTRQLPGLAVAGVVLIGLLGSSCQNRTDAKESYTDTQLDGYARSIIEIEPERQAAVKQIRELNGVEQVPAIACSEENSLDGHPEEVREIAFDYCARSIEIARENGLSIEEFNEITEELLQNPTLAEDVKERAKQIIGTEAPGASSESSEENS